MNHIYKTIWHAASQTWVVTSELASSKTKNHSKTGKKLAALSALVLGAIGCEALAATTVQVDSKNVSNLAVKTVTVNGVVTPIAETSKDANGNRTKAPDQNIIVINNGQKVTIESDGQALPKNVIVIGSQDKQVYDEQILIGYGINSPFAPYHLNGKSAGKAGDVVIGNRITLGGSDSSGAGAKDSFSTAVGYAAQVVGPVVAMGVGARSDMRAFDGWNSVKEGVVAVGPFALGADNKNGTTAIGAISAANYDKSVSLGALSGIAHNWEDRGRGEQFNPGISDKDKQDATWQILEAGGSFPYTRYGMTSIGYAAGARGSQSIASGYEATTGVAGTHDNGAGAVSHGYRTRALSTRTIAMGAEAKAGGLTSAQITKLDQEISRLRTMKSAAEKIVKDTQAKLNTDASAENKFKVASAQAAFARIELALERAINDRHTTNGTGEGAIAIGNNARANHNNATVLGNSSRASGERSNVIGYKTIIGSNRTDSSAVGSQNNIEASEVMVLGNNITVNNSDVVRNGAVILGHNSDGITHRVKAVNSAKIGNVVYSGFAGNLGGKETDGNPQEASNVSGNYKQGRFVSIGSKDNERQIKHVAAGEISATSTDAINGSQLYLITDDLGSRLTKAETNIANIQNGGSNKAWTIVAGDKESSINGDKVTFKGENGIDVSLDPATNTVTIKGSGSGSLSDEDKNNIKNDIKNDIANNIGDVINNANAGFSIKQNGQNTLGDDGKPLAATERVTPKDTLNFKNGTGTTVKAVTKKGEKEGDADTTTVSVDVDAFSYKDKDGNNVVRGDDGKYYKADENGNPTNQEVNDVVINITNPGGNGGATTITNVNDGRIAEGSKDAVNGGQLHETNTNVQNLTNRVNNMGDQINNINSRIDNMGNQVNQRLDRLDGKINDVDKRARRGIAAAGAMGMLPQPHISGKSMVSAATTHYRGQQAIAVGYSRLSDNGKHIIKFSGASSTSGKDAMVGAAYGFQW